MGNGILKIVQHLDWKISKKLLAPSGKSLFYSINQEMIEQEDHIKQ